MKPAYSDKYLLQETLSLSKKFNSNIFVETGTHIGDNILILKDYFNSLYTIEISEKYFNIAKEKISKFNNIKLYLGDSSEILTQILNEINSNPVIFLDAHWNEINPILNELDIIKNSKLKPIIIIHDFFVPDGNGNSKFKWFEIADKKLNIRLDFQYIKNSIEQIYGNNYDYYYNMQSETDSGVIFIYEKINN